MEQLEYGRIKPHKGLACLGIESWVYAHDRVKLFIIRFDFADAEIRKFSQ